MVDFTRNPGGDTTMIFSGLATDDTTVSPQGEVYKGEFETFVEAIMLFERHCFFLSRGSDPLVEQTPVVERVFRRSINGELLIPKARHFLTMLRKQYGLTIERANEHIAMIVVYGMYLEFETPAPLGFGVSRDPLSIDTVRWREVAMPS